MAVAVNEQVEAAESDLRGTAPWTAPRLERLNLEEAAGGDSFSGDAGNLS